MATVLAISTNTRLLGLAVISEKKLVDYSIRLHKSSWSPSKATVILASLKPCVRRHYPQSVILSIPHAHYQTEAFIHLIACIREYFETKGIPVSSASAEEIYSLCSPSEKKRKKNLMTALCSMYPQLSYCYHKEARNKTRYYIKVFEAVAAATLHTQEM